ncbi:MAG: hypothetical protein ABIJ59_07060 [Pseudomonadota bacterium]
MILFCEDCGSKNHLEQPRLFANNALFKCTSCGYQNKIKTESQNKKAPLTRTVKNAKQQSNKIDDYFHAIQSTPDIVGSFLYHIKNGVVKNHMPDVLELEDLIFLGKTLVKNYKICSFVFPDITRMTLVIDKKNLVLQMINTDLALILSCQHFPIPEPIENLLTEESLGKMSIEV